jgi:hypothetical protein
LILKNQNLHGAVERFFTGFLSIERVMADQPVTIIKKRGSSDEFQRRIKQLGDEALYVGIPAGSKTGRSKAIRERAANFTSDRKAKFKKRLLKKARTNTLTNAQALLIFSKGSLLHRQPARPVIEPAIQAKGNKERIVAALNEATQLKLAGKNYLATKALAKAGRIARDAAKDWFYDGRNGWAGNAQSTIDKKGFDQPGIDTEAMRNAITYTLKGS